MKVGAVSDVHLGNFRGHGGAMNAGVNQRAQLVLDVLARTMLKARELELDALVICGDLFDYADPGPQLLRAVQDILAASHLPADRLFILKGNHDEQSDRPNDHALAPLHRHATIVEEPEVFELAALKGHQRRPVELVIVPFRRGKASGWLPGALAPMAPPACPRALFVHLGLIQAETPPYLLDAEDAIDFVELARIAAPHGISATYAGNWHNCFVEAAHGVAMIQMGALCPTGWDNPGTFYGVMGIWDPFNKEMGGLGHLEVIPGPRFLTSMAEIAGIPEPGYSAFVRLKAATEAEAGLARGVLLQALTAGQIAGGEVVMDKEPAKQAAHEAAKQTRSAGTLAEALDAYVAGVAMEPGVDRGKVLERCKAFLAKASE